MKASHIYADRFHELAEGAGPDLALLVAQGVLSCGETVQWFADHAQASEHVVKRHLAAWQLAASLGLVDAKPEDGYVLSDELRTRWKQLYQQAFGRDFPAERAKAAVNADPAKVVAAMKPEQKLAVVTEILRTAEPKAIREVQQVASARHEELHADEYAKAREAERRLQEERRERIGFRMMEADSHLLRAKVELRKAVDILRSEAVAEAYVEGATHRLDEIERLTQLARIAIGAESDVDWDAELSKIGADQ